MAEVEVHEMLVKTALMVLVAAVAVLKEVQTLERQLITMVEQVVQAEVRATPPLQPVAQLAKGFQVVSAMAMGIAVL